MSLGGKMPLLISVALLSGSVVVVVVVGVVVVVVVVGAVVVVRPGRVNIRLVPVGLTTNH